MKNFMKFGSGKNGESNSLIKSDCLVCGKSTGSSDKISLDSGHVHKSCFQCDQCSKKLDVNTFQADGGKFYCPAHSKKKPVSPTTSPMVSPRGEPPKAESTYAPISSVTPSNRQTPSQMHDNNLSSNNGPEVDPDSLAQLKAMFENVSDFVIRNVMRDCRGNMEMAIDSLLNIASLQGNRDPAPQNPTPQHSTQIPSNLPISQPPRQAQEPANIEQQLMTAARQGNGGMVKHFFREVKPHSQRDFTPLIDQCVLLTIERGNADMLVLFLEYGANPNGSTDKNATGVTPLNLAIMSGHVDCALVLVNRFGANPNLTHTPQAPLHLAIQFNLFDVVKILLEKGADVNKFDTEGKKTSLHYAVESGEPDIVQKLLEFNADIAAKDGAGETALHTSLRRGKSSREMMIVGLLLEKSKEKDGGRTINEQTTVTRESPLHIAASRNAGLVQMMINYRPNALLLNAKGETATEVAEKRGDAQLVLILKNLMSSQVTTGTSLSQSMKSTPTQPVSPRPPLSPRSGSHMPSSGKANIASDDEEDEPVLARKPKNQTGNGNVNTNGNVNSNGSSNASGLKSTSMWQAPPKKSNDNSDGAILNQFHHREAPVTTASTSPSSSSNNPSSPVLPASRSPSQESPNLTASMGGPRPPAKVISPSASLTRPSLSSTTFVQQRTVVPTAEKSTIVDSDYQLLVDFRNFIDRTMKEDQKAFMDEFNDIEEKTVNANLTGDFSTALQPHNLKKNRYKNILPYEKTMVKLAEIEGVIGSEFVSANYITGTTPGSERAYIATQGPLQHTLGDFWRMIWECKVLNIVMLANEIENGREKVFPYWPEQSDIEIGSVIVSATGVTKTESLITRKFIMKSSISGESRIVTQYQYVGWPDQGLPATTEGFNEILELVDQASSTISTSTRNDRQLTSSPSQVEISVKNPPILVHCSAGIGRTGVFCAVHNVVTSMRMLLTSSFPNVNKFTFQSVVMRMREDRAGMIQTFEQYAFCYLSIAEKLNETIKVMDYKNERWFHKNLEGKETQQMLEGKNGGFLFRISNSPGYIVLSYNDAGKIMHSRILVTEKGFNLENTVYPSLNKLVEKQVNLFTPVLRK